MSILHLIAGFVILVIGANKLVNGVSSIANHMKVSKTIAGLSIMAFGTSMPDLFISFRSMITGNTAFVMGDVIGSCAFDILLIIGVVALIGPFKIQKDTITKELPILLITTIIFSVFCLDNVFNATNTNILSRSEGIVLVIIFSLFVYYIIRNAKTIDEVVEVKYSIPKSIFYIILGFVLLVLSSKMVVDNASIIAKNLGISDYIISVTIVAIGTCLPEFVAAIVASRKNENELVIGNIIGGTIFNICIVGGLPVTLFGKIYLNDVSYVDILGVILSALIIYLFAGSGRRVSKLEGILMILAFIIYYLSIIIGGIYYGI